MFLLWLALMRCPSVEHLPHRKHRSRCALWQCRSGSLPDQVRGGAVYGGIQEKERTISHSSGLSSVGGILSTVSLSACPMRFLHLAAGSMVGSF